MQQIWSHKLFRFIAVFCVVLSTWAIAPVAGAYNNPELLPEVQTPIIDLAELLTDVQEDLLAEDLKQFESQTGWKLRVLTQFDRTPGRAVKQYWGLDEHSVLLVADQRGGNILNFSVGRDLYDLLTRTFWVELQTRYGNQYFVRDNGEDQSILQSIQTIETCLLKDGGCRVVPGLPREQWILTLITSALGGVICGIAAIPRKPGQIVAWQWALIFSPLWGILFIAFGLGPVISRTSDWVPVIRNVSAFLIAVLAAYLTPAFNHSSTSET
ncbi:MAG: TPM domain-containing protein [Limnospira sp. PMC 1291.21]|uniref:TPM domain-containing protein n=3 Tax=Limnospira TaxID=2596745 RepID=A0A9P1KF08_9CYAN|nr:MULTISPECIES: TPM domain-containing protein [Limnospira]MDC0840581.1 TPM domain-containing protein [Limnoraphis robusta]MDY7053968.1 TPM domain-containing protein [Limnospira fusiformis LS22]QJB26847.1 TPM domain-containing protein [Limnospira fusiformis SAG 85.79]RAQ45774.1 TPM domain-containing protein [Arthrospira sp. O9.13F]UWU49024.1 putative membrane protein YgcG, contains a TPM-fold domain [Arthrospira platensis C1]